MLLINITLPAERKKKSFKNIFKKWYLYYNVLQIQSVCFNVCSDNDCVVLCYGFSGKSVKERISVYERFLSQCRCGCRSNIYSDSVCISFFIFFLLSVVRAKLVFFVEFLFLFFCKMRGKNNVFFFFFKFKKRTM